MALLTSSAAHDALLKTVTLAIEIDITGNATPASKAQASDIPAVAILRTEGITAVADAVEDLSSDFATAADATGVFGLLIDASKVGTIDKVMEVRTVVASGTLAATSPSAGSDVTNFLSTEGNIAIDLDSSVDLSAANLAGAVIIVTFKLK